MSMRGRGSAKRTFTSSPLMRTSSPGPTFCPTSAGIAVHGDAAGDDHVLHRAARAEAARGQHLVQALRLVEDFVSGRLVLRRRAGSPRSLQRQARLLHRLVGSGQERARECECRLGGLGGGIRHLQEVGGVELGERRQFRKRAQAEVVEEGLGRRVERRASRRLAMADDLDPLPVLERLDDVRGHGDAADGFDVAAGHGLLVGDDRQCFHHRARIARRLFRRQPVEVGLHRRACPGSASRARPARARPCAPPSRARSSSSSLRTVSASSGGSNSFASCATATGFAGHQQRGLEDALDLRQIVRRVPVDSFGPESRVGITVADSALSSSASAASAKAALARELHVDRRVGLGLRDVDQLLARELEHREERHDQMRDVGMRGEQRR